MAPPWMGRRVGVGVGVGGMYGGVGASGIVGGVGVSVSVGGMVGGVGVGVGVGGVAGGIGVGVGVGGVIVVPPQNGPPCRRMPVSSMGGVVHAACRSTQVHMRLCRCLCRRRVGVECEAYDVGVWEFRR